MKKITFFFEVNKILLQLNGYNQIGFALKSQKLQVPREKKIERKKNREKKKKRQSNENRFRLDINLITIN